MRKKFFTLLELLVSIGIISVLAMLLMPALNGGLRKARAVQCFGNLRQVGLIFMQYAADNQDIYPIRYCSTGDNIVTGSKAGHWLYNLYVPKRSYDSEAKDFVYPKIYRCTENKGFTKASNTYTAMLTGCSSNKMYQKFGGEADTIYFTGESYFSDAPEKKYTSNFYQLRKMKNLSSFPYLACSVNSEGNGASLIAAASNNFLKLAHGNNNANGIFIDGHSGSWSKRQWTDHFSTVNSYYRNKRLICDKNNMPISF